MSKEDNKKDDQLIKIALITVIVSFLKIKECNKKNKNTDPLKESVSIKINNPNGLNPTEIAEIIKSNIQHLLGNSR